MNLKTLKDLKIEEELCWHLDEDVYLPVKKELKGCGREYTLGFRKENFKNLLAKKMKELRQVGIERLKNHLKCLKYTETRWNEFGLITNSTFPDGADDALELETLGRIEELIDFFNITEEDLK